MLRNNLRLTRYANPLILQMHQHGIHESTNANSLKRATAKSIYIKANNLINSRRQSIYTIEELRKRSLIDELKPLTQKLRWLEFRRRLILGQFAM